MTSRPADGLPAPGAGEPIRVFAGVNGAGKSSVLGATFRQAGLDYFNPDEAARALMADAPSLSLLEANARAWRIGYDRLRQAVDTGGAFAFETTLGGETITRELERAIGLGRPVDLWYVGLDSAERHIARVRARVARGGHDIPEAKIRERYVRSAQNLRRLLPGLRSLAVFDNSAEVDPVTRTVATAPALFRLHQGRLTEVVQPDDVPPWAADLVTAAVAEHRARGAGMPVGWDLAPPGARRTRPRR